MLFLKQIRKKLFVSIGLLKLFFLLNMVSLSILIDVFIIILGVTNYSLIVARISALICNFTCEIAKLPWPRSVHLSAKMAAKF